MLFMALFLYLVFNAFISEVSRESTSSEKTSSSYLLVYVFSCLPCQKASYLGQLSSCHECLFLFSCQKLNLVIIWEMLLLMSLQVRDIGILKRTFRSFLETSWKRTWSASKEDTRITVIPLLINHMLQV